MSATLEPILLLGSGGHSKVCIDVVEHEGRFTVAGLTGLAHEVGSRILGYPVLGTDFELPHLLSLFPRAFVSVGQIETPDLRMRLFDLLQQSQCEVPTLVSPRAYVSTHAKVGAGTLVMHGAVINAGAVVGRNCIINSQALIEHDAEVGDHCHVSTNAALNSNVRVGQGTFIGSGSSIRQGIRIGERCLIGMAQRILADCPAGTRFPPSKAPA